MWGSVCVPSLIRNLCPRWGWAVSFTSLPPFHRGKSPRYPLKERIDSSQVPFTPEKGPLVPSDWKVRWLPELFWALRKREKSLTAARYWTRFIGHHSHNLVTEPTELSRFAFILVYRLKFTQFWTHDVPAGSAYLHRMVTGQGEFKNAEFEFFTTMWLEIRVSECNTVSTGE